MRVRTRCRGSALQPGAGAWWSAGASPTRHACGSSPFRSCSHRERFAAARCKQPSSAEPAQPWHIGHYYTKKRERRVRPSGEVEKTPDLISDPPVWNSTMKMRLAVQVVATELQLPESEVQQRLDGLVNVVPGLLGLTCLKEADLVRLAVTGRQAAEKLLVLKVAFPHADVASMVARCPQLLYPPLHSLQQSVGQARDRLAAATPDPSAVVAAVPMLARVEALEACLEEMQRLFGGSQDPLQLLCSNPGLADMCQSLQHQARGDRDSEYLADMYRGQ